VDATGSIIEWTGAAPELLGMERAQAIGRELADLFVERLDLESLLSHSRGEFNARLKRPGGELEASITAARAGDVAVLMVKEAVPAPGWASADAVLAHWDRILGSITREVIAAGHELGSAELSRIIARHGARMLPGTDVLFALVTADHQDRFQILAGEGRWAEEEVGGEWPISGTLAGEALTTRRAIETTRAQQRSVLAPRLARGGIQTARLVPLVGPAPLPDGRLALGVIGFFREGRQPFTALERRLGDEYSRMVTFAVHQAELRSAAAAAGARLETGVALAVELAHTLDPVAVIRRLLERTASACSAERAALVRVEGEETVVEDSYDVAGEPEAPGYRHPIAAQPLMRAAVESGQPVTGGAYESAVLEPPLSSVLAEVKHTVTLPLIFAGRVIAVMVVSRRRDVPFGPGEIAALRLIGNLAVLALRNSWLFTEAQDASRAKGEFLNMAAHELRTPLTVITGYLSLLREGTFGPIPDAWRTPLDTLAEKAAELGALIEDLLLASRLETGALPIERALVDLRDVVESALVRAQPRARLLGGRLERRFATGPVIVDADPTHLGRVLDNLLNNALTYSEREPVVQVDVAALPQPTVSVLDNGRGIAPEHRDRIFERFFRLDEHSGETGTGLGLYISRELVGRAGGSLLLEWSEVGRGSRFTIRLPPARQRC
jgi:signal transduction histidine kinase